MKNKERTSNLELLRIISIVMVIVLHYLNASMGGALENTTQSTNNYYIIRFVESSAIIAVNCFVLISGYFMVTKEKVRINKLVSLMFISIFYGGSLYIVSTLIGIQGFTLGNFLRSLIFIYGSKWFVGSYIILCLLSPFLNKLIKSLDQSSYKKLLIILIVSFCIIPTFFIEVSYNDYGYGLLSFITLYFIGGYLRLYYTPNKSKMYYMGVYILCTILTAVLVLSNTRINTWWNYNSIINVVSSVSLFLFFSKLNIQSNIINYFSNFSFVIYIIHSDASIRTYLYRTVFQCEKYWNDPLLLINMLITVIGIYFGCIVIELIRKMIVKPIDNIIKVEDQIEISA